MKIINLGIIGLGTVGQAFIHLLEQQQQQFQAKLNLKINVYGVSARTTQSLSLVKATFKTQEPLELCQHPNIDIIIELAGGYESPRKWVLESLKNKKRVITANKALLAKYGSEIFPFVKKHESDLFFEAAIGGGIPLISSLQEIIVGNTIHSFACIINGTCNYILTEMKKSKQNFKDILIDAQKKGYAEVDPSFDIEGIDTAHKVALLASLISQTFVPFENLFVEGITKITPFDLEMVSELGFSIKLLGQFIVRNNNEAFVFVCPTLVPKEHQLNSIQGVLNALYLKGSACGPILLTGAGAGGSATASAVMSDLLKACSSLETTHNLTTSLSSIHPTKKIKCVSIDHYKTEFYLRIMTKDKSGAFASISQILAKNDISIEAAIQKPTPNYTPIIIRTHQVYHKQIKKALQEIDSLNITTGKSLFLHIYHD